MNKLFRICLFSLFLVGSFGCNEINKDEEQMISMLREFYTAYNVAWTSDINSDILIEKLNSLQQKYCTDSLNNELNIIFQNFGLDHDILINDLYTDIESLKEMTIKRDVEKENVFIISYPGTIWLSPNKYDRKKVTIHVEVVMKEGQYKINDVW